MLAFVESGRIELKSLGPQGVPTGQPVLALVEPSVHLAVVESALRRLARGFPVDWLGENCLDAGDRGESDVPGKTLDNYGLYRKVEH